MTVCALGVFTRRPVPAPDMLAELARLRAAWPSFEVIITSHSGSCRYEAIRRHDGPGLCCVISSHPADLWRELASCAQRSSQGSPDL
jgi:hypothetical protein